MDININAIILYIDPATGSMLFSVLLGVFITAGFFLRMLFIKLKTIIGGKATVSNRKDHHKYLIYTDDKRYWNCFEPIVNEFEKREIDVCYWTSSKDDPVFDKEYKHIHPEFIGKGNQAFIKLNAADSDILLSTTPGLDVLQWKRSKGVKKYVHIFHSADSALAYGMLQLDFFDVVLTSSDFMVEEIRSIERIREIPPKEIEVVGLTYFDVLNEKLKKTPPIEKDNTVILLAPSWGKSGFLYRFGDSLIDRLIDTGYEIVFRPHPQSFTADKEVLERVRQKYAGCKNFIWNTDNDNFSILNKSDLLISDFSAIVFDYAIVFGKPIMYTSVEGFDDSVYDSSWLDDTLWKFKVLPTIGCEISDDKLDDLKTLIDETISSDKYEQGIVAARDYCWKNQGHAAETIVNYLTELQSKLIDSVEVE